MYAKRVVVDLELVQVEGESTGVREGGGASDVEVFIVHHQGSSFCGLEGVQDTVYIDLELGFGDGYYNL